MKPSRNLSIVTRCLLALPLAAGALTASASDLWLYSGRDFTGAFARVSRSEPSLPIGAARSIRVGTGV